MTAGQTYFVHIVAGNDTGNGVVDASDICYSQSVNGVPVVFFAPPQGMISGDTTICAGETANITFEVSGVFPITMIYTIAGEQQAPLIFNSSPFTVSVTPAVTTTYAIFMLTDASLASCTSGGSNQVTVQVLDGTLEADAGSDFLSCDNSTNLQAVLPAGTTGNWTTESTAVIASAGDPQTIVSGLESGANIFIWTITDAICSGVSSSDTMIVYYQQGQLIEDDSFSTLRNEVLEGDVTLNDGLIPGADWTINTLDQPATGVLLFNSDGTFTYTPDGEYSGEVYFSYEICSEECPDICDTAQVEIFIGLEPINSDSILNIPNGITPNGDGANDVFYIENLAYYPGNDIIIFNRWGDIVYKAKPYLNDWNGTSQQGKPLPDGTYYYILRLDIGDGEMYKGDITILKN
jgi:gliding motility-associated-like protein